MNPDSNSDPDSELFRLDSDSELETQNPDSDSRKRGLIRIQLDLDSRCLDSYLDSRCLDSHTTDLDLVNSKGSTINHLGGGGGGVRKENKIS